MRFVIGKTSCAGCGRPLDVMDDVVPVTPLLAAGTKWSGHFHRGCFDRLPDRAKFVRKWRDMTENQLRICSRLLPTLASSPRYIAVDRTDEDKIGLYFLDCWAEHRFERADEWGEFRDFLEGDDMKA